MSDMSESGFSGTAHCCHKCAIFEIRSAMPARPCICLAPQRLLGAITQIAHSCICKSLFHCSCEAAFEASAMSLPCSLTPTPDLHTRGLHACQKRRRMGTEAYKFGLKRTQPPPVVRSCTLGGPLGNSGGRKMSKMKAPFAYGVSSGPMMSALRCTACVFRERNVILE